MKKHIHSSIIAIILAILIGLGGFWYENRSQETANGLRELLKTQFVADQHHLDLRSKGYTSIPDICSVIKRGKEADDIWSVDLGNNDIASISVDLSCLKNLSELNLGFNKIRKIQNIGQLRWLNKLDLGNNEISRIEGLETLQRLQNLHLGYNQLTSTVGLEKLINLSSLQLQRNKLTDISSLAGLANLETLKLEFNELTDEDVTFIPSLKKLKIITVAENKIDLKKIEEWNALSLKNIKS